MKLIKSSANFLVKYKLATFSITGLLTLLRILTLGFPFTIEDKFWPLNFCIYLVLIIALMAVLMIVIILIRRSEMSRFKKFFAYLLGVIILIGLVGFLIIFLTFYTYFYIWPLINGNYYFDKTRKLAKDPQSNNCYIVERDDLTNEVYFTYDCYFSNVIFMRKDNEKTAKLQKHFQTNGYFYKEIGIESVEWNKGDEMKVVFDNGESYIF